jgi:RNA polymerase sigma-70 factor, ECF subfamily
MVINQPAPDLRKESDEQLMHRVRLAPHGDLRAFEILVERYKRKVINKCRHLTGNPLAAEDLAQEVFVKAYFGVPQFQGRASFRTWLYRIKVNHCLNFLKSQDRVRFVELDDAGKSARTPLPSSLLVQSAADATQLRQCIVRVLDHMNETLRVPLLLCDMNGFSYEEIAQSLGISLSATKMRIKRGREEFRELFQKLDPPPRTN